MNAGLKWVCTTGALALILTAGCGGEENEGGDIRARNLKTGAVETFGSTADVPDDYLLCTDAACSVPSDIPCDGLGALVCQLHPECRVKVLSCLDSDGQQVPVFEADSVGSEGSASSEAPFAGSPPPGSSELCEVTCVPEQDLTCEQIADPSACLSQPDCEWGDVICAACACAENMPCDCGGCIAGCFTRPPLRCEALVSEQECLANPECQWGEYLCPVCACAEGQPCDCPCPASCTAKPQPACEELGEQECLASPLCEWGQFICPPCAIDGSEPGAPAACDCGLSCRSAYQVCPAAPMPAIGCADGSPLEPIYDPRGCIIGWRCLDPSFYCGGIAGLECPVGYRCEMLDNYPDAMGRCVPQECAPVMCEMYCEFGFKVDENGCEICSCNQVSECKRTGCSGQICSDQDVITTCEYLEYYQCFDLAECGITSAGRCGWIPNDAFNECMTP